MAEQEQDRKRDKTLQFSKETLRSFREKRSGPITVEEQDEKRCPCGACYLKPAYRLVGVITGVPTMKNFEPTGELEWQGATGGNNPDGTHGLSYQQLEAQVRVLAKKLADRTGRCPIEYECWEGCPHYNDREHCSKKDYPACWQLWAAEKAEVQDDTTE